MTTAPSFAAAAGGAKADAAAPLTLVRIDGHVLLRIAKHCRGCAPALVTGQLLGLDVGTTLEVTEAFPFPVSRWRGRSGQRERERSGAERPIGGGPPPRPSRRGESARCTDAHHCAPASRMCT